MTVQEEKTQSREQPGAHFQSFFLHLVYYMQVLTQFLFTVVPGCLFYTLQFTGRLHVLPSFLLNQNDTGGEIADTSIRSIVTFYTRINWLIGN